MANGGQDLADTLKRIDLNDGQDLENDAAVWSKQDSEKSLQQTQECKDTKYEKTNKETLNNVHAVIMHAEADKTAAEIFQAEFQRSAQDMEIETLQEFANPAKTHFDNVTDIMEKNHFVLLWVTANLGDEKELLQMFLADISLTESKSNIKRYEKFIPIWGEADAKSLFPKLKPFTGFNYHDVKDDFNKLRLLINQANPHSTDSDTDDIDLK